MISLIDKLEILVRGGELTPAGWSPDGGSIYALHIPASNDVLSIPAAGGMPHTIITTPEDIVSASVSADGKKSVYSVAETKSDVWIVDNFDPAYRK